MPLQAAHWPPGEAEPRGPKHPAVPTSQVASTSPLCPVPPCWWGSARSFHRFGEGGWRQAARPRKCPSQRPQELPETFQLRNTSLLLVRPDKLGAWPIGPAWVPVCPILLDSSLPALGAPWRRAHKGAGVGIGAVGAGSEVRSPRQAHHGALASLAVDEPGMGRAEQPGLQQVSLRDISVHGVRGSKCWGSH